MTLRNDFAQTKPRNLIGEADSRTLANALDAAAQTDSARRSAGGADNRGFVVAVKPGGLVDVEIQNADLSKTIVRNVKPELGGFPLTARRYSADGAIEYAGDIAQVWRTAQGQLTCQPLAGLLADGSRDSNFWGKVVSVSTRHRGDADDAVWLNVAELKTGQVIPVRATSATADAKAGDSVMVSRDDGGAAVGAGYAFNPQYYAITKRRGADDYNAANPRLPAAVVGYANPNVGLDSALAASDATLRLGQWRLTIYDANILDARLTNSDSGDRAFGTALTPITFSAGQSDWGGAGADAEAVLQIWTTRLSHVVEVSSGGHVTPGVPDRRFPSPLPQRQRHPPVERSTFNGRAVNLYRFTIQLARSVSVVYADLTAPSVEGATRYAFLIQRSNPYTNA